MSMFLYNSKKSGTSISDSIELDPRVGTLNEEIQNKFLDLEQGKISNKELARDVLDILKKDSGTEPKQRPANKPK